RSRVVVGLDAKVLHLTQQVLGANYQRLVSRAAGRVLSQQAPERVAP
ncbi:MAG: hypothetical protein ACI867_000798, partial [Glaciecola sp.]